MTRARSLLVRAVVVALLLLTVSGTTASADGGVGGGPAQPTALPDDPGYGE